jgi:probable rRNA maturation factor
MAETGTLVEAVIEDARWEAVGLEALAERAARAALRAEGVDPSARSIGLLGCDDARIAALNAEFRGKASATNVLSWPPRGADHPIPGEPESVGDLALSYDTCAREAAEAGLSLGDHATHLLVHGVLHLLGRDHADDAEAAEMQRLETKILASLGVADPYVDQERP